MNKKKFIEAILMDSGLLLSFEKELSGEAERLANLFLQSYRRKEKVNMEISLLIKKNIKSEFSRFSIEIEIRILSYIPSNLTYDNTGTYIFITKDEAAKHYIIKYVNQCFSNVREVSYQLAKLIVQLYKKDAIGDSGIFEILSRNMEIYKENYEISDLKAVLLYLQADLEKLGYRIVNIKPLEIIKKN